MRVKLSSKVPSRKDEQRLWALGHEYAVGVDEVGRGCLAGPLTVAAVVLPRNCDLSGVRDSKVLTAQQRLRVAVQIKACAVAIGIGWASSEEIDELGLTRGQRLAAERALGQILLPNTAIILDGRHNYIGNNVPVYTIIRGDQTCLPVSAAAIVAKVARDRYMALLHRQLSGYGFGQHKGYGTAQHIAALQQLGPSRYHRRSYQPVADLISVG